MAATTWIEDRDCTLCGHRSWSHRFSWVGIRPYDGPPVSCICFDCAAQTQAECVYWERLGVRHHLPGCDHSCVPAYGCGFLEAPADCECRLRVYSRWMAWLSDRYEQTIRERLAKGAKREGAGRLKLLWIGRRCGEHAG